MRIVEKTITFDVAEALEDMGKEEIYDLISEIESDQYDLLLYFFQKIIDELVELGATDTKMLTETLEDTFKGKGNYYASCLEYLAKHSKGS